MTWIVKVALGRPLTFIVMALLLLIFGLMAASKMAVDIFPDIGIPMIGVAFQYASLSPQGYVEPLLSRPTNAVQLTTNINDIEHTESMNRFLWDGRSSEIFFQPDD